MTILINFLYLVILSVSVTSEDVAVPDKAAADDSGLFTLSPIVSSISVSSSVHEYIDEGTGEGSSSLGFQPASNSNVDSQIQSAIVDVASSVIPARSDEPQIPAVSEVDEPLLPVATPEPEASTTSTSAPELPSTTKAPEGPRLPVAEIYLAGANDELTLLTNTSNRAVFIDKSYIFSGSEFVNIVLVCSSTYPIRWIYEGDGAPTRMYSSELRTFEDFNNQSTYEYFTTLVLMQERNNEHLTGTYSCRGTEYPNLGQVFYHLYFPGGYGFPTIRNRVLRPPKNDSVVNFPCKATNPNLPMTLYKIYPKDEAGNITSHEAVTYDPRIGFNLDLSRIERPFGSYYCSLNDFDSFWKIDLVPRKEDEVVITPNELVVPQKSFYNQNFTCEAKENVQIVLPQGVEYGSVQYFQNTSSEFPFVGIFTVNVLLPLNALSKYFKVQCISRRTRRVLHTWEYSSIGAEELSIKYDAKQRRILCCSKSGLTTTQEVVKCETRSDCEIKKKCFENGRCEYPFPPKYTDAPQGCTAMEFLDRVPTHVVKCAVGDSYSKLVTVTQTIGRNDIYMNEDDNSVPPTELILRIALLSQTPNNEVKVKCSGNLYYFSTNFVFAWEKADGSIEFLNRDLVDASDPYAPILVTRIRRNIRTIYCYAPISGSSEWRNVSVPVYALEPTTTTTTTTRSVSRGAPFRGRTRLLG